MMNRQINILIKTLLLCITGTMAGCMVGPDFQKPIMDPPAHFRAAELTAETTVNLKWWELFDDPVLHTLVVTALEGHTYQWLKDKQTWRDFDHQSVQTVYAVKCKPQATVMQDKYKLDYFEIIKSLPGDQAVCTREQWEKARKDEGLASNLEPLVGAR